MNVTPLVFSNRVSVPQTVSISGVAANKMFANAGDRDPIAVLESMAIDLAELGYDDQAVTIDSFDPSTYRVMVSTSADMAPMVIMYAERNYVFVIELAAARRDISDTYLRYVLEHGTREVAAVTLDCDTEREHSVIRLEHGENDGNARRAVIQCVSELMSGFDAEASMSGSHGRGRNSVLVFEIRGDEHAAAAKAVCKALARGYKGVEIETRPRAMASIRELVCATARRVVVRNVVRHVIDRTETATIFEDSGVAEGDRVIINDGTAREPVYLVGTVVKTYPVLRRIDVSLDSGSVVTEQIDNGPTGMLGFARVRRTKIDPIRAEHLRVWLDHDRWISDSARAIVNGQAA